MNFGEVNRKLVLSYYKKKGLLYICDETTKRNLLQNDGSILEFTTEFLNAVWRLTRNKKAIEKENLQVFVQFDPVWAKHHYGNETQQKILTQIIFALPAAVFLPQ